MHSRKINNGTALTISVYLIGIFLVAEVVGAMLANSLTLLADAAHMLSDFLALLLSLVAYRYESKPADDKRSYGYSRMQIIASFVNGITLLIVSIMVSALAVVRLFDPPTVEPDTMLIVSGIGVVINLITLLTLNRSEEKNLNMKGAILHIVGDLLGFIAAMVGAIVIKYTDLHIVDPILSIIISILILNSAFRITKESMHILMEGAPEDLKENDIRKNLLKLDGVADVQHIHLWLLNDNYRITTLHLLLDQKTDPFSIVVDAKKVLSDQCNIQHSTIEVERYDPAVHQHEDYSHHHRT